LYPAILVTLKNGTSYIPMTKVKNKYQAKAFGLPIGTCVAIAVPIEVNPQGDVNEWRTTGNNSSFISLNKQFKQFWGAPAQDYKVVDGPMYDAYGNFEFGATGAAAGFNLGYLQLAADIAKGTWSNNPINYADINSGYYAITSGGTLSVKDWTPPAPTTLQ
jgi:hypothetical protein